MAKESRALPINSLFTRTHGAAVPNPAALSTAISELFPAGVAAAELVTPGDPSLLHPGEAQDVANAVPKRVAEFAAGRLCARRALGEFGIAHFPLRMAPDRSPLWPETMVGSITHTRGRCAAVVGERRRFASLGLDVEGAGDVKRELWRHICVPDELDWLGLLPTAAQPAAATLVFSAKEAFYKCQYPVTRERLTFADVCVKRPDPDEGGWVGTVLIAPMRPLAISAYAAGWFRGTYRIHEGYVSSGFCLPASEAATSPTESESRPSATGRD